MATPHIPEFHITLGPNGGVQGTFVPVDGVVISHVTATDAILSIQTPQSFSVGDQSNGKMKNWIALADIGSYCIYMGNQFEVIQSGDEKLLMLSEIIMKDKDEMRDLYLQQWIDTLSDIMRVPLLRVMNREQMGPIQNDERIFQHGMIYLSSSRTYDNGSYYFWEWNPAYSCWFECSASCTYCNSYYDNYPMALRCVVELS